MVTSCSATPRQSSTGPCTCGKARYPYESWIRAASCGPAASNDRTAPATRCCPAGRPRCTARAYGSIEPRTASRDSAATTTAASSRPASAAQARAASPRVAALLLMNPGASAGRSANRGGGPVPVCQARSPSRHSPAEASAVRSPVPIAPYSGTGGVNPRLIASASTFSTSGCTPEPPAPIWFSRTTSMARTRSGARYGPAPAAWLRSSRSPCCPASAWSSATVRFAPTPVVRPYTGRCAAISRAACQAARARLTAPAATLTWAPCRATAPTWPQVSAVPSMTTPGPVILCPFPSVASAADPPGEPGDSAHSGRLRWLPCR